MLQVSVYSFLDFVERLCGDVNLAVCGPQIEVAVCVDDIDAVDQPERLRDCGLITSGWDRAIDLNDQRFSGLDTFRRRPNVGSRFGKLVLRCFPAIFRNGGVLQFVEPAIAGAHFSWDDILCSASPNCAAGVLTSTRAAETVATCGTTRNVTVAGGCTAAEDKKRLQCRAGERGSAMAAGIDAHSQHTSPPPWRIRSGTDDRRCRVEMSQPDEKPFSAGVQTRRPGDPTVHFHHRTVIIVEMSVSSEVAGADGCS